MAEEETIGGKMPSKQSHPLGKALMTNVLSYMGPRDLIACSSANAWHRHWASHALLWRRLWRHQGWALTPAALAQAGRTCAASAAGTEPAEASSPTAGSGSSTDADTGAFERCAVVSVAKFLDRSRLDFSAWPRPLDALPRQGAADDRAPLPLPLPLPLPPAGAEPDRHGTEHRRREALGGVIEPRRIGGVPMPGMVEAGVAGTPFGSRGWHAAAVPVAHGAERPSSSGARASATDGQSTAAGGAGAAVGAPEDMPLVAAAAAPHAAASVAPAVGELRRGRGVLALTREALDSAIEDLHASETASAAPPSTLTGAGAAASIDSSSLPPQREAIARLEAAMGRPSLRRGRLPMPPRVPASAGYVPHPDVMAEQEARRGAAAAAAAGLDVSTAAGAAAAAAVVRARSAARDGDAMEVKVVVQGEANAGGSTLVDMFTRGWTRPVPSANEVRKRSVFVDIALPIRVPAAASAATATSDSTAAPAATEASRATVAAPAGEAAPRGGAGSSAAGDASATAQVNVQRVKATVLELRHSARVTMLSAPLYARAGVLIFVYAVDQPGSLQRVRARMRTIEAFGPRGRGGGAAVRASRVLVANKADLPDPGNLEGVTRAVAAMDTGDALDFCDAEPEGGLPVDGDGAAPAAHAAAAASATAAAAAVAAPVVDLLGEPGAPLESTGVRVISREEGMAFAAAHGMSYVETSGRTGAHSTLPLLMGLQEHLAARGVYAEPDDEHWANEVVQWQAC